MSWERMIAYRFCGTVLLLFTLSGCYHSIADLKTEKNYDGKIEVSKNYQAIYRDLLTISRSCMERNIMMSEITVTGELYADIKEATIHQKMTGGGILISMGAIDIKGIDDYKTEVTVYGEKSYWYSGGDLSTLNMKDVQRWLNRDNRCFVEVQQ
jgi:hypothetical protein